MITIRTAEHQENTEVATSLHQSIKILCLVVLSPETQKTKGMAIKNSWGKRCTKLLFMSTKADHELDIVLLPKQHYGIEKNWFKTREALRYAYEHHSNEFDWIYKAEDNT
jgi:glycoprotein-N-acetylgalactosamine 3-beta-galactosyltransferase